MSLHWWAFLQSKIDRYDTDGDGKLNEEEQKEFKRARDQRRKQRVRDK